MSSTRLLFKFQPKYVVGEHFWNECGQYNKCDICNLDKLFVIHKFITDNRNNLKIYDWQNYANKMHPCLTKNELIIKNIIE